ncbi:MAG TPA: APC family permease [Kineosporiaceae bacterium]|nr:APC family permease [Kineosporiaceae bacterium]
MNVASADHAVHRGGGLRRTVGFYGLLFVSLGSIIGSGWLLGALNAAQKAGPASIISWVLAASMLGTLALTYAELGATYPVAGGSGRFPYYSHGPVIGFAAGWVAWLQAVFIAPIEVLAAVTYVNSVGWVDQHLHLLNASGNLTGSGLVVSLVLMLLFTALNLAGARFMSESNTILVIWKTAVPFLAVGVISAMSFHPGNFTAGGGFLPHGFHGVFAALTGGVVFALQGFEQAVQLAGEARNPRRDLSRAVLGAMAIGALLYSLLQVSMIAGLNPADIATNWDHPLGKNPSDYGAWYTLALAVGATWLAVILIIDAVLSPAGTGIVYVGTTARLSYALGEEREMPGILSRTDSRGVPVVSILITAAVGLLGFLQFKSWSSLVNVVTGATAIMYALAPIALATLKRSDGDRPRSYHMPAPRVILPLAFVSANLILYWGGFDYTWKLACALLLGMVLFAIGSAVARTTVVDYLKHSVWLVPWIGGTVIIGALGQYGDGAAKIIPEWWDIALVAAFSLSIFRWAVSLGLPSQQVAAAVEKDSHQLAGLDPA